MPITYRRVKGEPLTHDELDDNFEELRNDLDAEVAKPSSNDDPGDLAQLFNNA